MRFNVTFPMFAKINVEGENVSPLWEYLSKSGKISGN